MRRATAPGATGEVVFFLPTENDVEHRARVHAGAKIHHEAVRQGDVEGSSGSRNDLVGMINVRWLELVASVEISVAMSVIVPPACHTSVRPGEIFACCGDYAAVVGASSRWVEETPGLQLGARSARRERSIGSITPGLTVVLDVEMTEIDVSQR